MRGMGSFANCSPFRGLIRPLKGLIRLFKGLIRPFKGLIAYGTPPIWKEKDKGRQTYWTRNRKREWTFFVGSVFWGRPFL